ncbi:A/G-specific adenine glycosylase [Hyphobacterium marinum]|uniref:Adenine DNA glycosylase n=1 Tax=Hyphobacterium marinum TaxID=3116574 RepID=A0ABU7M0Y3_9PROT|nr:A/G-specific adenine glycosylase [Hyphobacterium sp. Y6023]MEE2567484.1 A/G-specific adenine glycosylase [Hyphobacterium sp. Y6023]
MTKLAVSQLRTALLDWYDRSGRTLPWRLRPEDRAKGAVADPYAVWLSEIMLQQTTVPHATPYWHRFLERWPTVEALAEADDDDVMAAWAGLGYYARARNLLACARMVAGEMAGRFPDDLDTLRTLPGIGDYTANAIRAAAFDKPASVVDGNVERVLTRLFRIETPLPKAKPDIRKRAAVLADPDRPGDYAQAIMDLGATVCTPRSPDCATCPWAAHCAAHAAGVEIDYPRKLVKTRKPVRRGIAYAVTRRGAIWLRKRPEKGLLGGMMEVPSTEWGEAAPADAPPFAANWQPCGTVRHVFTHFTLDLAVVRAEAPEGWQPPDGRFVARADMDGQALPSLFGKVVALVAD